MGAPGHGRGREPLAHAGPRAPHHAAAGLGAVMGAWLAGGAGQQLLLGPTLHVLVSYSRRRQQWQ
jgi:hypothetical protein